MYNMHNMISVSISNKFVKKNRKKVEESSETWCIGIK